MNWKRWARPGLILTLIVAAIAVIAENGPIERDIDGRVTAALAAQGLGWASTETSARDVTIRGVAPSPEAQQLALNLAAEVPGVRAVSDGSTLLPIASPFVWIARREGGTVTLSGSIPSEGTRAAILAAARRALPDAEIRDAMSLARGAGASFSAGATFALARLASLAQGSVTLTDGTLAVSGTASSAAAYAAVRTAVASPPGGVTLGPAEILPQRADPFVFSANFDGKAISLVGYAPNDVVHGALVATARAALPGVPVNDTVAIASGAPSGFAELASFGVAALDRLSQGGITLDGLNLDVSGTARSVDDYEALLSSLSHDLPSGAKLVSAAITPAAASPYFWEADRAEQSVTLLGYVPSPEDHDDVLAAAHAAFPALTLVDRIRIAAGEPRMDWIGAVKFSLSELVNLASGKVTISDQTLSISGEASSADTYAAMLAQNSKTLPASLTLGSTEVTPPRVSPYTFVVLRQGTGVVLSGYAPDATTRDAIEAAAKAKFGDDGVTSDLAFGDGAPDSFSDAVDAALEVASRLAGGHVALSDNQMTAAGFLYQPGALDEITDRLSVALPSGFAADTTALETRQDDQPVSLDDCHGMLADVLKTGSISFDGAQADIASDSLGLLDRVAAVVARCPDADVQVGAYSDSQGSASKNRDRTQARADAIVDFLVSAGVKRERLSGVGYGEDHPIADNGTAEGRAQNERVEFSLSAAEAGQAAGTGAG